MSEKQKKQRLDEILVEHNFFETKSKAQASIMAGDVKVNDKVITKAGFQIAFSSELNIEINSSSLLITSQISSYTSNSFIALTAEPPFLGI